MNNRDIDSAIAEFIGWTWIKHQGRMVLTPPENDKRRYLTALWDEFGLPQYLPKYSSDCNDTWAVIDQFEGYAISSGDTGRHICKLYKEGVWYIGDGDTVPLAICAAALKSTYKVEVVS